MMREILFRGKRMDNEEWVKGDLIREPWGYCIQVVDGDGNLFTRKKYAIDTSTVGQYTGLLDKNGKHIFEGDIIEQSGCRWIVGFQNNAFVALEEDGSMQFALFEQYIFDWNEKTWSPPDYFEIIGNIHDNQQLLCGGYE